MAENRLNWLITGASRGIGLAIARTALRKGDRVVAGARTPADLDALKSEFPENLLVLPLDMTRSETLSGAVDTMLRSMDRIDVLVNNAGYGLQGMIEEVTMEQVRHQMEVNFFGLTELTQRVIPHMRRQGSGYVVNISSIAGLRGAAALGIYNASKFAVEGFTEALAQEMKPFGVRVSVVEPGPYRTDWSGSSLMRSGAMENLSPDSPYAARNRELKQFFDERSGKQPGDPYQIADVLWLASRHPSPPLHMLFGDIAAKMWEQRLENLRDPSFFAVYPHEKNTL